MSHGGGANSQTNSTQVALCTGTCKVTLALAWREFCAPQIPQKLSSYISIKLSSSPVSALRDTNMSKQHHSPKWNDSPEPPLWSAKISLLKKYGWHFQNILKIISGWRTALYKNWSSSSPAHCHRALVTFCQTTNHTPKTLVLCNVCNWSTNGKQNYGDYLNKILEGSSNPIVDDQEPKAAECCLWKVPKPISFQMIPSSKQKFPIYLLNLFLFKWKCFL